MESGHSGPFNADLVTRSLNYNGHQMLQLLLSKYPDQIHSFKLQDINYREYQFRINNKSSNYGLSNFKDLHPFIESNADFLFRLGKKKLIPIEDEKMFEDRNKHLVPLEKILSVPKDLRLLSFVEDIEVGDLLLAVVDYHCEDEGFHFLRPVCFDSRLHRFVNDVAGRYSYAMNDNYQTLKVVLHTKDTSVTKGENSLRMNTAFWNNGVLLRVEVLHKSVASVMITVGTRGDTLNKEDKQKKKLGLIKKDEVPPILK